MTQAFGARPCRPARKQSCPPSTAHSSADAQPGLQQGAQRTRDRILQAARELVLEEGASRLTLDAVVVRAGLSKGRFYHFKTKRDLFVTLIDEMIRAFDAVQANHERRFAGDPDPWLSSQVEAMPDDEMQKMGAALLAAAAEDPTLSTHCASVTAQYERVRRSPRGTETAALIMLALDGALFADLLGLPILAPAERRHFFRALQDLASGHLELVPAKGRT